MDTCINFRASLFITPAALALRMGRHDAPCVLDVRPDARYLAHPRVLAGALRCAPEHIVAWADGQRAVAPDRDIVVYCVYGHRVSLDAAAALRSAGLSAWALAGGFEGGEPGVDALHDLAAWRAPRPLTLRKRPDLGVWGDVAQAPSRWVTRARPKIDRIACPWLVRRFIDARAEFFYVPTAQVLAQATHLKAVAFDMPGAPVSHEGHACSFDTLLRLFDLQDPALDTLARIVRGADTDSLDLAAQSAGLLALSLGLSALHADDHAMLAAAMPLYDALYAWCRSAQDEPHSWQPGALLPPTSTPNAP